MEVMTVAALAALVVKVMTVVKSVGKDNRSAATQVVTWVVGVGVAVLGAHAQVTQDLVVFGSYRLGDLDTASLVLAGLSIASLGSIVGHDLPSAIDSTGTVAEPPLLPSKSNVP